MTGDSFQARIAKLVVRLGSAAELARRSGLSERAVRNYMSGENEPKQSVAVRLADAAGVRLEWLLRGTGSMVDEPPKAEEPGLAYQALNLELMSMIVSAVEELQPLGTAQERAALIALAYDYMMAKESTEKRVLDAFLAQWAKSAPARPPAVPQHERRRLPEFEKEPATWTTVPRRRKTDL